MALYKDGVGYSLGNALPRNTTAKDNISVRHVHIDFAKIKADREEKGVAALANGDVIFLGKLPASSVIAAAVRVLTAEGSNKTIDIGREGRLTNFSDNLQTNAVGTTAMTGHFSLDTAQHITIRLDAVPEKAILHLYFLICVAV